VADIGATAVYTLFVVPDEGEARILCKIPVKKASYLHSFALTENYFILQVPHTPTFPPPSLPPFLRSSHSSRFRSSASFFGAGVAVVD
jgi:carotenoid cleavage dioxygenase-like enzyme